jgi:4-amino-4-deoxychorismate lyase
VFTNGERLRDALPLRTLFYGEGVFETFRFRSDMPVFFERHIERMRSGAELLRIPFPEANYIADTVLSAVTESGLSDLYVKVCLVSGGNSLFYENADKTSVITVLKEFNVETSPAKATVYSFRRSSVSPLLRIKSLNYLENILARREALDSGFDEAIFLNERDEIAEGSASNIFWVSDGTLFTPAIDCGVLPGIIRGVLIERASDMGLQVEEGKFKMPDLTESDFAFFTNSLSGLREIAKIHDTHLPVDNRLFATIKENLFDLLKWS